MGFLNLLNAIEIGECNGKIIWKLHESLIYLSDTHGEIIIPEQFETDLASVPRIPIVYMLWGDRAHREAVLHDYLYRIDAIPSLSRTNCDAMFREAMISRNQPSYIYNPMWTGVRVGGWRAYHRIKVMDKFKLDK